jgi:hypothetical protein
MPMLSLRRLSWSSQAQDSSPTTLTKHKVATVSYHSGLKYHVNVVHGGRGSLSLAQGSIVLVSFPSSFKLRACWQDEVNPLSHSPQIRMPHANTGDNMSELLMKLEALESEATSPLSSAISSSGSTPDSCGSGLATRGSIMMSSPTYSFADSDDLHRYLLELEQAQTGRTKPQSSLHCTGSGGMSPLTSSLSSGAKKLKFDWLRTNMRTMSAPRLVQHVKPPSWSFQKLDSYTYAPIAVRAAFACSTARQHRGCHDHAGGWSASKAASLWYCHYLQVCTLLSTGFVQGCERVLVAARVSDRRKGPAATRRIWRLRSIRMHLCLPNRGLG